MAGHRVFEVRQYSTVIEKGVRPSERYSVCLRESEFIPSANLIVKKVFVNQKSLVWVSEMNQKKIPNYPQHIHTQTLICMCMCVCVFVCVRLCVPHLLKKSIAFSLIIDVQC